MIRPSLKKGQILIVLMLIIFCSIFGFPFGGDKISGSLIASASAQTAEDYFQQGKAYLENDSLVNAHTNFQNALSLDPNHQGANLFYAFTRILMISTSSDFNSLLDRANVSSSGRDIFNWQADFQRDYSGKVILPPNTPTGGEMQTFLMNSIAPEVDGAISNLSKVGNTYQTTYDWTIGTGSGLVSSPNTLTDNTKYWNYNEWVGTKITVQGAAYTITANNHNTLFVSPNWIISPGAYSYKVFERIIIDYGDILVMKGFLYLAKGGIWILSSYNLDIQIDTIVSYINSGVLEIQDHIINTYQQFLTLLSGQQLSQAKAAVKSAISTFVSAIDFISADSGRTTDHLFLISSPADETRYRAFLDDINNALDRPTLIRDWNTSVNLSEFFDNPKNVRSYLPEFQGSMFIQRDSYPDPTFGGLLPSMTSNDLNQDFQKNGLLVDPPPILKLYDSFSDTYINKGKWMDGEFVREIDPVGQKLVSKVSSPNTNDSTGYTYRWTNNFLRFFDPGSVNSIQADVSVLQITHTNPTSATRAMLTGRWYNDGTPGGGDIWAAVFIGATPAGGLVARWEVVRETNPAGTTWQSIAGNNFTTPVNFGETYTLYIEYDRANHRFIFKVGSDQVIFDATPNWAGDADIPFKALATRTWLQAPTESGYISATFDNVYKNGAAYDDFSNPAAIIDPTNWATYEFAREILGGKLRSKIRSSSSSFDSPALESYLSFPDPASINALQTKVTPLVYQNDQGLNTSARIFGRFYNDGAPGNGYTGDVQGQVAIGWTDKTAKVFWVVNRINDETRLNYTTLASGTFATPVVLGSTYLLFLSWDGNQFTFKVGDETATYTPSGIINPPHKPTKIIGTRIFNPSGKDATVEALFDDVMINGAVAALQSIDFGVVPINDYLDRVVDVVNDGNNPITINAYTLPSPPFTIPITNCSGQLPVGGTCNFVVRFSPTTAGQFTSSFNVLTNVVDQATITVNLSGSTSIAAPILGGAGTLQWAPVLGATGYEFCYSTSSGGPYTCTDVGNVTSYMPSGLAGDQTYYFVVRAHDSAEHYTSFSSEARLPTFTIRANAGSGGIITKMGDTTPIGAVAVLAGGSLTLKITPNPGYHVGDVLLGGSSVGPATSYPFINVTADQTISATFISNTTPVIIANAGAGGNIFPSGSVTVNYGTTQMFTITPDQDYTVFDVLVNGTSVGSVTSYTFNNVQANHSIGVSFGAGEKTNTGTCTDSDGDKVCDAQDNCPNKANPILTSWTDIKGVVHYNSQKDYDLDGVGDVCDSCPLDYNPDQKIPIWYKDADNDGYSDGTKATQCSRPTTGYKLASELIAASGDCDDNNAYVNPGKGNCPPPVIKPDDIIFDMAGYDTWLPTDGGLVTVKATAKIGGTLNPDIPLSFSLVNVTRFPGKYTNDANTTDTNPDFEYTVNGNTINLLSHDFGGSITIQAKTPDGTITNSFTLPKDSYADGVPNAWQMAAFGSLGHKATDDPDGDGLTNFEEYRGFKWGQLTKSSDPKYKTPAYVPSAVSHFRGNPLRKDLFVKFSNYDSTNPFAIGEAFYNAGVDVHAVDSTIAINQNLGENNIGLVKVNNDLVNTYLNASAHSTQAGIRSWQWSTKGYSGIGTAYAYGISTTYQLALDCYFTDKPYKDGLTWNSANASWSAAADNKLNLISNVQDKTDNGINDRSGSSYETGCSTCPFKSDVLVPGSYIQQLTTFDINSNGMVELPMASDPNNINTAYEYTKDQVLKHTITHEMGHAVGMLHNSDSTCVMYQFSNNWSRDGHFSNTAIGQMRIHNP